MYGELMIWRRKKRKEQEEEEEEEEEEEREKGDRDVPGLGFGS
jgi:hypothetical protein